MTHDPVLLLGLLREAEVVLTATFKALLTVEGSLNQPYADDPRWSPWTRWCEHVARDAHDTAMKIRKVL